MNRLKKNITYGTSKTSKFLQVDVIKYEINDCFQTLVIIAQVPLVSLTREKKDQFLNLACVGFLCVTLPINLFSARPLVLKSPVALKRSIFSGLSGFLSKK